MVFLHGNPTWSFFFRHAIKKISSSHRAIALDHLGCGLSSKPQDRKLYTLEQHIHRFGLLIDGVIGSEKPVSLVLHDWGGAIGMGWAVKNPHRVTSLTLMNTAAFWLPDIPWRIAILKIPFLGSWLIRQWNLFAWPATLMATAKSLSLEAKEGLLAPYKDWDSRIAIDAFVQDIPLFPWHPTRALLFQIESGLPLLVDKPVYLLWGMKDFCFHKKFLEKWQKIYPHAVTKTFEEAGHYLLEDEPQATSQILEKCLLKKL